MTDTGPLPPSPSPFPPFPPSPFPPSPHAIPFRRFGFRELSYFEEEVLRVALSKAYREPGSRAAGPGDFD